MQEQQKRRGGLVKRRLKRKIVLGCLLPAILFVIPLFLVVALFAGMMTSATEDIVNEYKIAAMSISASWQDIVAFDTVRYENELDDVIPDVSALEFMAIDYEKYRKVTTKEGSYWVFESAGSLDTAAKIRAYFGAGENTGVSDILQIMGSYIQPRPYTFNVYSKTLETVMEEHNFTKEQMEWIGVLITEGLLDEMMGDSIPNFIGESGTGYFAWPLPGIPESDATSSYGRRIHPVTGELSFHYGTDISCPVGTPVIAVADGVVQSCSRNGGTAGVFVTVIHNIDGYQWVTKYFHLSEILCSVGDPVERGTVIGLSGNTGRTTGPHLHIETICNGSHQNPLPLITSH